MSARAHNSLWSVSVLALVAILLTWASPVSAAKGAKGTAGKLGKPRAAKLAAKPANGASAHAELQPPAFLDGKLIPAPTAAPAKADKPIPKPAAKPAAIPPMPKDVPLNLRKGGGKPLELANETPTSGWWYKLLACGLIIGGAVWLIRKRKLLPQQPGKQHSMTILGRTGIGVRSELLIVDIDGQKILLGVTPSSIQRLAVLVDSDDVPHLAEPEIDPQDEQDVESGFDSTLGAAKRKLESLANRVLARRSAADELNDELFGNPDFEPEDLEREFESESLEPQAEVRRLPRREPQQARRKPAQRAGTAQRTGTATKRTATKRRKQAAPSQARALPRAAGDGLSHDDQASSLLRIGRRQRSQN